MTDVPPRWAGGEWPGLPGSRWDRAAQAYRRASPATIAQFEARMDAAEREFDEARRALVRDVTPFRAGAPQFRVIERQFYAAWDDALLLLESA